MDLTSLVAAGAGTGSGFVVGLVLGGFTAFTVAPAIHMWLAHREWMEASREDRLADRLLERMEIETDGAQGPDGFDEKVGSTWRTRR